VIKFDQIRLEMTILESVGGSTYSKKDDRK